LAVYSGMNPAFYFIFDCFNRNIKIHTQHLIGRICPYPQEIQQHTITRWKFVFLPLVSKFNGNHLCHFQTSTRLWSITGSSLQVAWKCGTYMGGKRRF
jgi:hypothetical protein